MYRVEHQGYNYQQRRNVRKKKLQIRRSVLLGTEVGFLHHGEVVLMQSVRLLGAIPTSQRLLHGACHDPLAVNDLLNPWERRSWQNALEKANWCAAGCRIWRFGNACQPRHKGIR